jgi:hypothetical protein
MEKVPINLFAFQIGKVFAIAKVDLTGILATDNLVSPAGCHAAL